MYDHFIELDSKYASDQQKYLAYIYTALVLDDFISCVYVYHLKMSV